MLNIPGYTIEDRLGQGSSGVVFQAREIASQRRVALRILSSDLPLAPRRAMLADARDVGAYFHPHLMMIFAVGETDAHQYVAMELLAGGSLRQRLRTPMAPQQVLYIIRCLAEALGYLHSCGLVHRDIRPRNILFRLDGTPVLADVSSQPLPVGGIHRYLSPEQRGATRLQPSSDLYALGLVFLEMLGVDLPPGSSVEGLVLSAELEPLRAVLERLLARDPAARYSSAEDFIQHLDHQVAASPLLEIGSPRVVDASFSSRFAGPDGRLAWVLPAAGVTSGLLGAALLSSHLLMGQYPDFSMNLDLDWNWLSNDVPDMVLQTSPAIPLTARLARFNQPLPGAAPSTPSTPDSPITGRGGAGDWPVRLVGEASRSTLQLPWQVLQPRLAAVSMRLAPGASVSLGNDHEPLLERLLATAQRQYENLRLSTPAGDNAVETYRSMLSLKPDDPRALAGLAAVAQRYLRWAERAWQQGSYRDSLDRIERGLSVDPDHADLLALRKQVRNQWQQSLQTVSTTPQRVTIPGGPFNRTESTVAAPPQPDLWNRSSR